MTIAVAARAFDVAASAWRRHGIAVAVAAAAILLLFRADLADLTRLWWTSTTYGHCLFVAPVAVWLVWQRWRELAVLDPVAWWPGLTIITAGAFAWLIGDAGGVALARHMGLIVMLQGAAATLLGPNVARGLLFPLGYLLFLVPFGQELEPPLQRVTVAIVMLLLDLVGVPARVDGVLIHAGRYWFEVAEACSGSKFVLAMLAFGVLVAGTCFWSWRRRAAFLLVCVVVPMLANGVRAFATIWAADLTSVEAAAGLDHIVYGWVFFAAVMAGVLALGWRWFDRAPDDPAFDPKRLAGPVRHQLDLLLAALLAVAIAAAAPAWSAAIAGRAAPSPARIDLPDMPGWTRAALSRTAPWRPHYPGADHTLFGRYANARGHAVDVAVALYARQEEGRELVAFGVGPLREGDRWVRIADGPPVAGGSTMRIVAPGPVERVVATWYRVGQVTTAHPHRIKFETARARLLSGDQRAVALHLSAEGPGARAAVERFVAALGPIGPAIDRIAAAR